MIKKILLLTFLIYSSILFSQENALSFGVKGGLTYASFVDNISYDIPAEYSGNLGFQIGGFTALALNEKMAVRAEILFSQQNTKWVVDPSDINIADVNDPNFYSSFEGTIQESMLLLPVLFEYSFTEQFYVEAGPQLGYSLNRKLEYEGDPNIGGFIRNGNTEKFEVGVGLGVGYWLSKAFALNLRYTYSIVERYNVHTSVLQLGAYYSL
ncbi:MAG: hypothetical protein CMC35_07790 [Flavobacteriaceae bacterium]|nr:hypothetical protein [Flavobacteriaceae bacterium]|tara:strand:- start:715 stop:1344 length:630 start_codon:yes stop_codon:yes gene_type:complete